MSMTWGILALTLIGADPAPEFVPTATPLPKVARPRTSGDPAPLDTWELSLAEAIHIGLDNSECVRLIEVSAGKGWMPNCSHQVWNKWTPLLIAPVDSKSDRWRFRAEVMAEVRSVVQQYGSLVMAQAWLRACEKAERRAREVFQREQAELQAGRGAAADVAEAEQRLNQFTLDVVTRTSDVITTERQLRNILGLPPADNRRIVPTTAPTTTRVQPDWDECLAAMMRWQPDIARQQEVVDRLERQTADALATIRSRMPLADLGVGDFAQLESLAWDSIARDRGFLKQVVHQSVHSVARFFLDLDTTHQQYQTATRLRDAARKRLDAQRPFYEEGRIPVERYLDAISQDARAEEQEAQYLANYNVSLAALEEAKGTLLDARRIQIPTLPIRAQVDRADGQLPALAPLPKVARPRTGVDPAPLETWELSLDWAIHIGLDNSECIRLIELRGQGVGGASACVHQGSKKWDTLAVAPVDPSRMTPQELQNKAMAEIRAIEQLYWALAAEHVRLRACEDVRKRTKDLLERERVRLREGRSTVADIAEIEQRFEEFNLDLVTKTSDVITTERRLRNVLGLPPADNRGIIPTTAPTTTRVEPEWKPGNPEMRWRQGEIRQQLEAADRLERETVAALLAPIRAQMPWVDLGVGNVAQLESLAWDWVAAQRTEEDRAVRQFLDPLARFHLEVDSNFKQYQTATRVRETARKRLDAQRAFYEEGRIPVDRYLDAISHVASAKEQEAQYLAIYNVSLAVLEEARGTLLDARRIKVAEPPYRVKRVAVIGAQELLVPVPPAEGERAEPDPGLKPAAFEP